MTKVQKGTARYDVTAALGKPIESYKNEGKDIDVFQADPDGRYPITKTAVTTFNTVADIFTIGMWEAVATPAEMLTKHKLTTYVVTYAPDQTVQSIEAVAAPPKPVEQAAAANPRSHRQHRQHRRNPHHQPLRLLRALRPLRAPLHNSPSSAAGRIAGLHERSHTG